MKKFFAQENRPETGICILLYYVLRVILWYNRSMLRRLLLVIDKIEDACRPDRGYKQSAGSDIADSIGLFVICALLLFTVFL